MKKILAAMVVLSGLGMFAASGRAATTADLTITVTPLGTKSIAIDGGATSSYDFGTLALAVSSISATAVVVDNDGQVPMQVGMQITDEDSWTAGAAGGDDVFNLRALLNDTGDARPVGGDFAATDDLTTGVKLADGTNFAGTYTGANMPPAGANSTKDLWLRIDMPTTSAVTAQQSLVVQLSAN